MNIQNFFRSLPRIALVATAVASLGGCIKDDTSKCDWSDQGMIRFVPTWTNSIGLDAPAEFTLHFGGEVIDVATSEYATSTKPYEEQNYTVVAHNEPENGVTINGTSASVNVAGGYAERLPDWLWGFSGSHDLVKETANVVDMPMQLMMKQLNITVKFADTVTEVITDMSSELGGVATGVDVATGTLSGEAKIKAEYSGNGDRSYVAAKRFLGVTGSDYNKLSFVVETDQGQKTFDVDITSYMVDFNTTASTVTNVLIVVNDLATGGDVDEWEPGTDPEPEPVYLKDQLILMWYGTNVEAIVGLEIIDNEGNVFSSPMKVSEYTCIDHRFGTPVYLPITTQLTKIPQSLAKLTLICYYTPEMMDFEEDEPMWNISVIRERNIWGYDPVARIIDMAGHDAVISPPRTITDSQAKAGAFASTRAPGAPLSDRRYEYYVRSAGDLNNVRFDLAGDYDQQRDIDLSKNINTKNWTPVGEYVDLEDFSKAFHGIYKGNGYAISNLNINGGSSRYAGLFEVAHQATIENVTIASGSVNNTQRAGALVGCAELSVLTNCVNYATVTSEDGGAGGIASFIEGCEVTSCINNGDVTTVATYAGGVAAISYDSQFKKCSNTKTIISGANYAGGIVGYVASEPGGKPSFSECTNSGAITSKNVGTSSAGGICGRSYGAKYDKCSNSATITGHSYIGGVVGCAYANRADTEFEFTDCSNSGNIVATDTGYAGGIAGVIAVQAASPDNKSIVTNCTNTGNVAADNDGVWCGGIAGYVFGKIELSQSSNTGTITGAGGIGGVYGAFGPVSGSTATINPISTLTNCFNTGRIGGGDSSSIGGLGGRSTIYTEVTDCYNEGYVSALDGSMNVGGLIGYAVNAKGIKFNRCRNSGKVAAVTQNIGGLVGLLFGRGVAENSYNEGIIDGSDVVSTGSKLAVGGIFGYCGLGDADAVTYGKGLIQNCYNTATIRGGWSTGGIAGALNENYEIIDCYNTGRINSTDQWHGGYTGAAGIAGAVSSGSKILRCRNTGDIDTYAHGDVGGIVGALRNQGTDTPTCYIVDCYNTGNITASKVTTTDPDRIGGIVGSSSGTISGCYSTGIVTSPFVNSGAICGINYPKGTISSAYWYAASGLTNLVGTDQSVAGNVEVYTFGESVWPAAGGGNWASSWKSLGSWNTKTFPKLAWEK